MPKNKHNKPIELHFWPTPNGQKIAIALEELELPYVIHPVNITRGDQFKPEYLAISPNNKTKPETVNYSSSWAMKLSPAGKS